MALAAAFHVSVHTVMEIREANADKLPDWRASTKAALRAFVLLGGERLVSEVKELPIALVPVSLAIAVDKLLLLDGEATTRTDHVHRVSPADFGQWLAKMSASAPGAGSSTIIEVQAEPVTTAPEAAPTKPASESSANIVDPQV
jgi:hypothetical protein